MTSNGSTAFMITSPNSPPIGFDRENLEQRPTKNSNFLSHKSTLKIDEAVKKIKALNEDTHKHVNPKAVFLDTDKYENMTEEFKTTKAEGKRIRKEQVNLISIIRATQQSIQKPSTDNPPLEQNLQQNNNMNTSDHSNQPQIECTVETKPHNSITSSTTSQHYHTPPVSPGINEISQPNTKELHALSETLSIRKGN